jgi:hypothetical protein
LTKRKDRFETLNEFVRTRQGWIVSVPDATDMTIECLPNSALPNDLRALGYDVMAAGEGERILPTAIIERFVSTACLIRCATACGRLPEFRLRSAMG